MADVQEFLRNILPQSCQQHRRQIIRNVRYVEQYGGAASNSGGIRLGHIINLEPTSTLGITRRGGCTGSRRFQFPTHRIRHDQPTKGWTLRGEEVLRQVELGARGARLQRQHTTDRNTEGSRAQTPDRHLGCVFWKKLKHGKGGPSYVQMLCLGGGCHRLAVEMASCMSQNGKPTDEETAPCHQQIALRAPTRRSEAGTAMSHSPASGEGGGPVLF